MEHITSRKNPLIIEMAKLKMKKYRDLSGQFIAEGEKLFSEARNARLVPRYIFVCEDVLDKYKNLFSDVEPYVVTREVYEKISLENSPQGIMTVYPYIDSIYYVEGNKTTTESFYKINEVFKSTTNGYIIIENIQDTGNVGTIIRSALAFDINAVIIVGSADVYNPKTIRAAMGALYKIPILIFENIENAVAFARIRCKNIYAAALSKDSLSVKEADFTQPCAVLIGNEGNGLTQRAIDLCDRNLMIPINSKSESLNAAIAAAVFMDHMRG